MNEAEQQQAPLHHIQDGAWCTAAATKTGVVRNYRLDSANKWQKVAYPRGVILCSLRSQVHQMCTDFDLIQTDKMIGRVMCPML